jgi:hypothetical protein
MINHELPSQFAAKGLTINEGIEPFMPACCNLLPIRSAMTNLKRKN